MKRGTGTALALALAMAALGAQAGAQESKLPDLKGRSIVAVTENAFMPLNFADPKTGKGIGWEYDAVGEIAKRLDAKLTWKVSGWDAMIQAVHEGTYDVGMDGISVTDERKAQVDFSDPYIYVKRYMLVRADEKRFSDPKTFGDDPKLLIGAQAGTTNFYSAVYEVLDGDEKNPRIKLYQSFGAAAQALLTGAVDMVLMDSGPSKLFIQANPGKFKTVGDPIGHDSYGFIFKKGSDLVKPFNAAIAAMKADGTLDDLTMKWYVDYAP
jgi:polar amino acid transport system substrate-binding protein